MCELCEKVKNSGDYKQFLSKMHEQDILRLEHSKNTQFFSSTQLYSTIEYPKILIQPLFEPKVAFATPINYFQNIFINDEKLPGNFSHGATRSIFFLGKRLIVFTKSVATHEAKELFSSFLLAHFEPAEYSFEITPENRITISADAEKPAKNLLTEKVERIKINFTFAQENLEKKLLHKNEALGSTLFVNQFKRIGMDARVWLSSTQYMFDYVSSVAHFSPHPYMLQIIKELGYSNQQDFQNHAIDYFKEHLQK